MISTLRRPDRLLAAVGVGVVAVAAFLPWVTSVDVKGVSQVLGGFDGAADGFIEFLIGAGLLAVLASRGAQTSRVRTVQLLPAILGSVCLLIALDAVRAAQAHLDAIQLQGGRGELQPGLWLLVLGASVAACGGLVASVRVARANPPSYDASEPQVLDREFGALIVVGVAGFLVGVGAGPLLARTVLGAGPIESYVSLYGAILGGFLGGGLAVSAWRRLRPSRRLRDPRRHR